MEMEQRHKRRTGGFGPMETDDDLDKITATVRTRAVNLHTSIARLEEKLDAQHEAPDW
jgi:hypothetical protein